MQFRRVFAYAALAAILASPLVVIARNSSRQASSSPQDKDLLSLEAAGWKLVHLLKDGNAQELPELCWKNGVTIDLGGTTVYPADLKKMMATKNWFYCSYFDTDCIHQAGKAGEKTYSYRELLLKATSVGMKTALHPTPAHKSGIVTLRIDGGPAKDQLEKRDYNFIFVLDNGAWKITRFSCDPDSYF